LLGFFQRLGIDRLTGRLRDFAHSPSSSARMLAQRACDLGQTKTAGLGFPPRSRGSNSRGAPQTTLLKLDSPLREIFDRPGMKRDRRGAGFLVLQDEVL